MKVETRLCGEIEVSEDKIIHFAEGIIGFPDCKDFTLIFDEEKGEKKRGGGRGRGKGEEGGEGGGKWEGKD